MGARQWSNKLLGEFMPIQVFEETRKPSTGERLSGALDKGMQFSQQIMQQQKQQQQMQRENEAAKSLGFNLEGFESPEFRMEILKKGLENQNKSQKFAQEMQSNQQIIRDLETKRDLKPGSLQAYVSDPKMAEQVSRPAKETKKTQAAQPIDPAQIVAIQKVRALPNYKQMDEGELYQTLTDAGVSKENAQAEADIRSKQLTRKQTGFQSAYKAQEEFINDTTNSYKSFETEFKPRLLQMGNIPDEQVIGPTAAVFLEHLGIPLGALENPGSELYNKLSQDLLKGLPETYGNRILKVEVDNFLKTIPTLLNSPNGRRMIASNMLKLGEMKEVYYNEMRKQQMDSLDNEKNLPRDFQQRVFDQVKPQIDRINNEFVKLSEITSVPPDTSPYFGTDGQIYFVPKQEEQEWVKEFQLRKIW